MNPNEAGGVMGGVASADIRSSMAPEPTVSAAPFRAFLRYLESEGHDVKALLALAGMKASQVSDPMARVPLGAGIRLFTSASRETGDCGLTIKFARQGLEGVGGLLGYLAINAPSVRAFLQVLAGYAPIFVSGVAAGYREHGGCGEIYWISPAGLDVAMKPGNLFCATAIIRRIRAAAGPSWLPLRVEFEHRAPDVLPEELAIFGSRLRFDQPATRIAVDSNALAMPMPTANPELFEVLLHHAQLVMRSAPPERGGLVENVRSTVALRLHEQDCSLDAVARELRTSARALQRKLDAAGTSFDRIVDETRRAVADRLLRDTDRPLSHVAFDLGYNSQSAFTRAARRWFACSPRAYRQNARQRADAGASVATPGAPPTAEQIAAPDGRT